MISNIIPIADGPQGSTKSFSSVLGSTGELPSESLHFFRFFLAGFSFETASESARVLELQSPALNLK
jgi:hypothetical protein